MLGNIAHNKSVNISDIAEVEEVSVRIHWHADSDDISPSVLFSVFQCFQGHSGRAYIKKKNHPSLFSLSHDHLRVNQNTDMAI